jgi:16S rRNA (uracil1498-N3)-methyltransferase
LFVERGALAEGALVALAEEERKHARARRLADGDAVVLLDGSGREGAAVLTDGGASARVLSVRDGAGEPRVSAVVLLAAAEPARVEWAIEKGTECGAARFVLVAAERSQETHVRALAARRERLVRVAREAVKQCGRARVPEIEGPMPLEDALARAPRPLLVASPGAAEPEVQPGAPELGIAIGPEGGFTEAEELYLVAEGAVRAGLGPRILRLETAVVVLLSRLGV